MYCCRHTLQLRRQQAELDAAEDEAVPELQNGVRLRQLQADDAALKICIEALRRNPTRCATWRAISLFCHQVVHC